MIYRLCVCVYIWSLYVYTDRKRRYLLFFLRIRTSWKEDGLPISPWLTYSIWAKTSSGDWRDRYWSGRICRRCRINDHLWLGLGWLFPSCVGTCCWAAGSISRWLCAGPQPVPPFVLLTYFCFLYVNVDIGMVQVTSQNIKRSCDRPVGLCELAIPS